ncbi:helix-turn-helix domain-containing protein [Yersinia mollaretii]|uniref:winged helix-turn-helix domain-containing protein n=1 Tax=Yersinia mollaretii TaxID=33060 RepID=UPI001427D813|nr:helix-turn-helix domain-containing protein [Yersinia mollaretii]MDA5537109.1 helix-turn-helix domain-containing protein [Yersinia mollaretii]NIL05039.1 helix-turn-helix domain-containing protein [Yersinia mollaretii]
MLMREECIQLLSDETLTYNELFTLQCSVNKLVIHASQQTVTLSEGQKRLLVALLKGINCKREIISLVWYENHQRISDNNYHQLIFQLRALLQRHNVPGDLIITVPHYGLKLNESLLSVNNMQPGSIVTKQKKKPSDAVPKRNMNSALTRIYNIGRSFFTS